MDKKLAEAIGSAARAARQRARLTQADVAERLGIASEVYGRLERGLMLPSVVTLRKLCVALAVPADELLGLREPDGSFVAEPPPSYGDSPELRRLLRRVQQLDRRKLRLLTLLAAALSR
ncbi:MAG TPA: helix-turn-helix transcriptional regulator [Longimicrobium sp.]|jgi:transcriptional regulator with XRE-family HTH domain|nr:helix-turn-helix transcriptional regulator [Longimicrobium sp.]